MTAWTQSPIDSAGLTDTFLIRQYYRSTLLNIDQSFYPWYTPGYTAQNAKGYIGGAGVVPVAYPADLTLVTVTGSYTAFDGGVINGHVLFWPMASRLTDAAGKTMLLPAQISVKVDSGYFSAQLPASNDPDVTPAFQYLIREFVPGGRVNFYATLDYLTPTVDISQLG